jgi:hypothetical protein
MDEGMHAKEAETLRDALGAFQKATQIAAEVDPAFHRTDNAAPPFADARIRITWQEVALYFLADIKNTLTTATLGAAIRQLRDATAHQPAFFPEKGLLVTPYVTPQMAERLREMDIPFIDTVGNAYINEPPLMIFIKGNKLPMPIPGGRPPRAFQPTGLQVVFALLCNPGLEKATFRDINKTANVALGTVNWVMRDLREMGYVIDMGKRGRRLTRKRNLLDRWAAAYPEKLRKKQLMGRYQGPDMEWWRIAALRDFEAYWGGEIAAAMLTRYLKPQTVTIYIKQPVGKLLLKHRITKDPQGEIEILNAFWNFEFQWDYPDLVHPVLIYTDLLATGDPRNIETAEMVYERELAGLVGED